MAEIILISTEPETIRVYVDNIAGANINSATFANTDSLSFGGVQVDNATTPRSVLVTVSGQQHGRIYRADGSFVLSAGLPLTRAWTLRCIRQPS